jgi:phosphomannomutase
MPSRSETLAELLAPLREKYFISGEINTRVSDMKTTQAKLDGLAAKYSDGRVYSIDGISVEYPDWHFNVRASNTEPMLRLNLEAVTAPLMEKKRTRCWRLSGREMNPPRPGHRNIRRGRAA